MKMESFNHLSRIEDLLDQARLAWAYGANHEKLPHDLINRLLAAIMDLSTDHMLQDLRQQFIESSDLED